MIIYIRMVFLLVYLWVFYLMDELFYYKYFLLIKNLLKLGNIVLILFLY